MPLWHLCFATFLAAAGGAGISRRAAVHPDTGPPPGVPHPHPATPPHPQPPATPTAPLCGRAVCEVGEVCRDGTVCVEPPTCLFGPHHPEPWGVFEQRFCCEHKGLGCAQPDPAEAACISQATTSSWASPSDRRSCCARFGMGCPQLPPCWDSQALASSASARQLCCAARGVGCPVDCTATGLSTGDQQWCCENNGVLCSPETEAEEMASDDQAFSEEVYGRASYRLLYQGGPTEVQGVLENPKRILRKLRIALLSTSGQLQRSPARLYVTRLGAVGYGLLLPNSSDPWSVFIPRVWNEELHSKELSSFAEMGRLDGAAAGDGDRGGTDGGDGEASGEGGVSDGRNVLFVEMSFIGSAHDINTRGIADDVKSGLTEARVGRGVLATTQMGYGQVVLPVGSFVEMDSADAVPGPPQPTQSDDDDGGIPWMRIAIASGAAAGGLGLGALLLALVWRKADVPDNSSTETMMMPPSVASDFDDVYQHMVGVESDYDDLVCAE